MNDNVKTLNSALNELKIEALCVSSSENDGLISYDLELKKGSKIRSIEKYLVELALALKVSGKIALKVLTEKGLLRLEIMKPRTNTINLFKLGQGLARPAGLLTCLLGETPEGKPLWMDLTQAPHLLVSGCSGSGKSTILHGLIANLLLYPSTELVLMDPKHIEFYQYEGASNRINVQYDYEQCLLTLQDLCSEMEVRYQLLRESNNAKLPLKILMIDEFADLMLQDSNHQFHDLLCRLSQKSRAAGIHIILSTQRPSVDVVSGMIKANFPARISCKVSSGVDSRVILDSNGAQHLRGKGDALLKNDEFELQRFQAGFTSPKEILNYITQ